MLHVTHKSKSQDSPFWDQQAAEAQKGPQGWEFTRQHFTFSMFRSVCERETTSCQHRFTNYFSWLYWLAALALCMLGFVTSTCTKVMINVLNHMRSSHWSVTTARNLPWHRPKLTDSKSHAVRARTRQGCCVMSWWPSSPYRLCAEQTDELLHVNSKFLQLGTVDILKIFLWCPGI